MAKKTNPELKEKSEAKRRCEICNNELADDEETYCNKCAGGTDDLDSPIDDILEDPKEVGDEE